MKKVILSAITCLLFTNVYADCRISHDQHGVIMNKIENNEKLDKSEKRLLKIYQKLEKKGYVLSEEAPLKISIRADKRGYEYSQDQYMHDADAGIINRAFTTIVMELDTHVIDKYEYRHADFSLINSDGKVVARGYSKGIPWKFAVYSRSLNSHIDKALEDIPNCIAE